MLWMAGVVALLTARAWSGGNAPDERPTPSSILAELEETRDWDEARARIDALFDHHLVTLATSDREAWIDAASARRTIHLIGATSPAQRDEILRWLQDHPDVMRALAFAVRPNADEAEGLGGVLRTLIEHRAPGIAEYPELCAALCVVHDEPMVRRINENSARSAHPVHIFDYFTKHEKRTWFGMRSMPARLQAYVVDTTATIDEMKWASHTYRRCDDIGSLFFEIEYDTEHFRTGEPKLVTQMGWTLPNIAQYGGVCADQAYFATTVGKSLGVPTTYTRGRSGRVGHAWVGVLEASRDRSWWDFNTGRYEAFQGVRGEVLDPQTRAVIPDSYVSLLAGYAMARRADRWYATAMHDAAARLDALRTNEDAIPDVAEPVRSIDAPAQLDLLEAGLRACPALTEAWLRIAELSERGALDSTQKRHWANALHRLCGDAYPDFYFDVLKPMIASVEDPDEQLALWEKAFARFAARKDLAAAVRLEQAAMFESHGDTRNAGRCYQDVIARYANDGPFVLTALTRAENLLKSMGAADRTLALYAQAWSALRRPSEMAPAFARQSNYYRIGIRYARRLAAAGRAREADRIRSRLGIR